MLKSAISTAFLALCAFQTLAQNVSTTKVGYSGVLTKTDGGLGGTVTVKDAMTLEITSYTLKDASAPALYWYVIHFPLKCIQNTRKKVCLNSRPSNTLRYRKWPSLIHFQ
jgi:hypothetical protein